MTRSAVSLQSIVVAAGEQISSDIGNEVVILNLANGVYYGLNEIGAFIWQHLQESLEVNDVCELLLAEYDVSREECERDVLALVQHLSDEGLIEVQHATPSQISALAVE